MNIQQFTAAWDVRQDRILLRFNTSENQEFSFWITRHVLRSLLDGAKQAAVQALEKTYPKDVAEAQHAFTHQATLHTADFSAPYQAAEEHPLGAEPSLVIGFAARQLDRFTELEIKLDGGKGINLRLTNDSLNGLLVLLEQAQEPAGWNIPGRSDAAMDGAPGGAKGRSMLH